MAPLAAIVLGAFAVEATLGFGATVIAAALGVFLLPIDELLPVFVPANVALSATLVVRHHRQIDRGLLLRGILPLMALGMPFGMLAARFVDGRRLETIFGGIVIALAAPELARALRGHAPADRPALPAGVRGAMLLAAGVVHGTFATGGPLVVWVADRVGLDKGRFRATLAALWLILGLVLIASFAAAGRLSAATVQRSALLVVPVVAGVVAGEWLHTRVAERPFRLAVLGLLCVAGVVIALR